MQDIWCHVHSLMPLRDAARAACLSRAFLHSWRCRPTLTLTREVFLPEVHSLHSHIVNASDIIDGILRNRSGSGVKILNLQLEGISLLCLTVGLNLLLHRWLKSSLLCYVLVLQQSTISHAQFYPVGFEAQFGILNLAIVPFAPQLNLAPWET